MPFHLRCINSNSCIYCQTFLWKKIKDLSQKFNATLLTLEMEEEREDPLGTNENYGTINRQIFATRICIRNVHICIRNDHICIRNVRVYIRNVRICIRNGFVCVRNGLICVRNGPATYLNTLQSGRYLCGRFTGSFSHRFGRKTDMAENFRQTTARIASNPATNDVLGGIGSAESTSMPGRSDT